MATKKKPNFAEAFTELEKLTEWFEKEDVDLDESMKKFERGLELASVCKEKLADVENKVKKLKKGFQELN
jgi:exodeoxyribonuclease VII small subunit